MDLKKKLSQLRKEKGLTQLELAETLQVSRQAVYRRLGLPGRRDAPPPCRVHFLREARLSFPAPVRYMI